MEILNNNQDDQQVVQEVQQTEQPDTGTPQDNGQQENSVPEFSLDKDGNFQWNTDEYDRKYAEEDSEEGPNQQQEQETTDGNGQ